MAGSNEHRKGALPSDERRILELMQRVNFGQLRFSVRRGRTILHPAPRVRRTVRFGGDNRARPELTLDDFALKAEVVEFLGEIRQLANAIVEVEVKHGLPFQMTVEETI
ncbi:MAG: hypothetical protein ABIH26_07180 [Candidatus Eisenbacteria bacterium]